MLPNFYLLVFNLYLSSYIKKGLETALFLHIRRIVPTVSTKLFFRQSDGLHNIFQSLEFQ